MAQLEAWEAEKKLYRLTDYCGGTFAYELKPETAEGELSHRICAACYQQGHKSILQYKDKSYARQHEYLRPACKTVFVFGPRHEPPRSTVNRGGHWAA